MFESMSPNTIRYERALVGHVRCNEARWVWICSYAPHCRDMRAFDFEWLCPKCGMFMCQYTVNNEEGFIMDVGCLFVIGEEEV